MYQFGLRVRRVVRYDSFILNRSGLTFARQNDGILLEFSRRSHRKKASDSHGSFWRRFQQHLPGIKQVRPPESHFFSMS
jgi:hypothetical protein